MKRDEGWLASESGPASSAESSRAPLYVLISDVLRRAMAEGGVEAGTVILEGPVAEILGCTRTPIRQALLELEGEGRVSRFDGRGYVAGPPGTAPRRVPLDAAMLGVGRGVEPVKKTLGWKAIYEEVERDVVHLSIFGRYRISELELARQFGVGRTAVRDVLVRLESLGLLEKDERQRWGIIPLDAGRINRLYELRWLLEPVALRTAATRVGTAELASITAGLSKAIRAYPDVTRAQMDRLEHDLHVGLLSHCPNTELLRSLQRTRCILTLSKHVLGVSAPMPPRDPFMSEHRAVLSAVAAHDFAGAEELMRKHLQNSCQKVTRRVELVRTTYGLPNPAYATPTGPG